MREIPIQVPQDRNNDFEPQVVPKYKKNISEIEGKIIAMYARGMSAAQVSEQIKDIYGFEVSEGMVTAITNKLLPEIEAWQKRPLSAVYPHRVHRCHRVQHAGEQRDPEGRGVRDTRHQ